MVVATAVVTIATAGFPSLLGEEQARLAPREGSVGGGSSRLHARSAHGEEITHSTHGPRNAPPQPDRLTKRWCNIGPTQVRSRRFGSCPYVAVGAFRRHFAGGRSLLRCLVWRSAATQVSTVCPRPQVARLTPGRTRLPPDRGVSKMRGGTGLIRPGAVFRTTLGSRRAGENVVGIRSHLSQNGNKGERRGVRRRER